MSFTFKVQCGSGTPCRDKSHPSSSLVQDLVDGHGRAIEALCSTFDMGFAKKSLTEIAFSVLFLISFAQRNLKKGAMGIHPAPAFGGRYPAFLAFSVLQFLQIVSICYHFYANGTDCGFSSHISLESLSSRPPLNRFPVGLHPRKVDNYTITSGLLFYNKLPSLASIHTTKWPRSGQ